jgi:hypothetical protein
MHTYTWTMRVSFYTKGKPSNIEFDDKEICGEFGSDSLHDIGRILNTPIEDLDMSMKNVIVTYRTLVKLVRLKNIGFAALNFPRELRFVIQCSRVLMTEEIETIENGIGRSVKTNVFQTGEFEMHPEWDSADFEHRFI